MNKRNKPQAEFAEKIMAMPVSFISRFLDIVPEELRDYSEEQLYKMVESTIELMPREMLRQFEIELEGGKREF